MYTVHGRTKILRLKLNVYYKIYNEPCVQDKKQRSNNKSKAKTTKSKASVSTLIQERGFQFGSKFFKT